MKNYFERFRPVVIDVVKSRPVNSYKTGNNNSTPLYDTITIPVFSISNVPWLNASFVVTTFPVDLGETCSIVLPVGQPSVPKFCLAVSDPAGNRYKIWENVGEILHYPKYVGQAFPGGEFVLEAWSVFGQTTVGLTAALGINISLITPETSCECSCVKTPYNHYSGMDSQLFIPKATPWDMPYDFSVALNTIV